MTDEAIRHRRTAVRVTRRRFAAGFGGALGLAATGIGDRRRTAARQAATPAAGATRLVESALGPVELPVDPRRVVAGYTTDMDVALVLGLPLVAGPGARGLAGQAFAPYQPAEALTGVAKVTTYPEANFEQIAAVAPDCIIDSADADPRRYELFSQIAPTFNFNEVLYAPGSFKADWRAALLAVGDAFGRRPRAEAEIAAYEERAAALRERLAERWAGATFVTLGSWQPGLVLVTDRNMHPALILAEDLGLTPAAVMPETFEGRPNLSLERLDLLDADLLFIRIEAAEEGEGRDRAALDGVQASPLWQRLPAVQAGSVVEYDAELFYASPLTAAAFLDVVEAALLP